MSDMTVIYYTSNRELPAFEEKIRSALLDAIGGLPLISVSQKPILFGHNICVGEVGCSNVNAFRQLQLGALVADTPFICTAESDFLYPREYFTYAPKREDVFYTAYTVYMLHRGEFYRFRSVNEGAMIVGRDYLIHAIGDMLSGKEIWGSEQPLPRIFENKNRERVDFPTPFITFKTAENMHHKGRHRKLERIDRLPYWGTPSDLMARYHAN